MDTAKQVRLLLWLMLVMWLFGSGLLAQRIYSGVSSGKWVQTDATILSAGTKTVKYRYRTPDGNYEGTRLSYKLSSRKAEATPLPGSKIRVFVNPHDYRLSVLEPGTDAFTVIAFVFSVAATALSAMALRRLRKTPA